MIIDMPDRPLSDRSVRRRDMESRSLADALGKDLGKAGDPRGACCGHPTHLRGTKVAVRDLADPPRTTDRWVILARWQCHINERHNGESWWSTDDPDEQPPWGRA